MDTNLIISDDALNDFMECLTHITDENGLITFDKDDFCNFVKGVTKYYSGSSGDLDHAMITMLRQIDRKAKYKNLLCVISVNSKTFETVESSLVKDVREYLRYINTENHWINIYPADHKTVYKISLFLTVDRQ